MHTLSKKWADRRAHEVAVAVGIEVNEQNLHWITLRAACRLLAQAAYERGIKSRIPRPTKTVLAVFPDVREGLLEIDQGLGEHDELRGWLGDVELAMKEIEKSERTSHEGPDDRRDGEDGHDVRAPEAVEAGPSEEA